MTGDEKWANSTILKGMQSERQHFFETGAMILSLVESQHVLTVRPPSPKMIGKDVYVEGTR